MNTLPALETPRLRLHVPGPEDAASMAAFVAANREHFAPWEPVRLEAYFTEAWWATELVRDVERAGAGTGYRFVLRPRTDPRGPILGQAHLSNVVRGAFQACHLGYGLDSQVVGQGVMHEALERVLRFAFEDLRLHRVMANYMPVNERSGALLRRLGFTVEGYARDYLHLAGKWQDHVLTALVNPDWRPA